MNPFDLKAALLAKHAQHPVIVHFPIALFVTSVAFDLLAVRRGNSVLFTVAYYNLLAAAVTAPIAIVTGLAAWQWVFEGGKLKGNLLLHLVFALIASGMICGLCIWRGRQLAAPHERPQCLYLALALITLMLVAMTGHLGGILSGIEGQ
jgi:uncharacterized membrane protein